MAKALVGSGLALILTASALTGCSSGKKGDPVAFCAASSQALALGGEIESLSVDNTAAVKAKVHAAAQAADTAAAKAPKEIRSSVSDLDQALDAFDQKVAAAKDSTGLTAAFNAFIASAGKLQSQSKQILDWSAKNCAAAGASGASGGSGGSGSTTTVVTPTSSP